MTAMPTRSADLAGQVVERRSDPLARGGQRRGDAAGRRGHGQAHAGAERHQPDGQQPVAAGGVQPRQHGQGRGDQDEPGHADGPGAQPGRRGGGEPCRRHHRRGGGQHADRADQAGVAPDQLQVLRRDEDEAEQREELHEDRQAARGQAALREDPATPPATAAQTPTARVRCCPAKVPVMVDRVAGMTSAAPRPSTARRAVSSSAERAVMATAEPAPKIDRPTISASLRP
jgi:hypothetical protein